MCYYCIVRINNSNIDKINDILSHYNISPNKEISFYEISLISEDDIVSLLSLVLVQNFEEEIEKILISVHGESYFDVDEELVNTNEIPIQEEKIVVDEIADKLSLIFLCIVYSRSICISKFFTSIRLTKNIIPQKKMLISTH